MRVTIEKLFPVALKYDGSGTLQVQELIHLAMATV